MSQKRKKRNIIHYAKNNTKIGKSGSKKRLENPQIFQKKFGFNF